MSKVIRQVPEAPGTVFIGERHQSTRREEEAVALLKREFPSVSYVTAPDGARFIPIAEAFHFLEELNRRVEDASGRALRQGYQQGKEEGLAEAREVLKKFETALADAVRQRELLLEEAREQILNLVLQISRKVTFDAIEADREATAAMIAGIISRLTDRSRLKIRVHPDFLPVVEANLSRYLGGTTDIKDLAFEADPRVKFGGCFIETPSGDIDARLESQFEVIADILHRDDGDK